MNVDCDWVCMAYGRWDRMLAHALTLHIFRVLRFHDYEIHVASTACVRIADKFLFLMVNGNNVVFSVVGVK